MDRLTYVAALFSLVVIVGSGRADEPAIPLPVSEVTPGKADEFRPLPSSSAGTQQRTVRLDILAPGPGQNLTIQIHGDTQGPVTSQLVKPAITSAPSSAAITPAVTGDAHYAVAPGAPASEPSSPGEVADTHSHAGCLLSWSPDCWIWNPYVAGTWHGGDGRTIGEASLFLPLLWSEHSLLFADVRGNFQDSGHREGNWGLAYRHLLPCQWILGSYGFFDLRETKLGNHFEQGSFGLEALSLNWDFRANGYIPDTHPRVVGTPTAALSGGNIVVRSEQEAAFWGFDGEVGRRLCGFGSRCEGEVRAFVGGYYFDNPNFGFKSFGGPRARVEMRLYDLPCLGAGSRLTLEGRVQYDDLRDVRSEALVTLRVPFGPKSGRKLTPMQRRMVDPIVRDVDIVTRDAVIEEPACFADRDVAIAGARVVNATNNLSAEVTAAGPNSVVVVDGRAGIVTTATTVQLQTGQVVMGGGSQLAVRGCNTGVPAVFTAPGTRPEVHGTNTAKDVFMIANDTTLTGMNITGGQSAVSGINVSGFTLSYLNMSGGASDGVLLVGDVNGNIIGNTSNGNVGRGLAIQNFNGGTISGNSASGNGDNGFEIKTLNGGTINGNTASGNNFSGFRIENLNGGTINGNTANGNGSSGFRIVNFNGSTFTGNIASANDLDGIRIDTFNGGTVSGNTFIGNGFNGFEISTLNAGTISGNTSNGNGFNGFFIGTFNGGTMNANIANGNKLAGFEITNLNGGTISGNAASGNIGAGNQPGFHIETFNGGTLSSNTASGNNVDGFDVTTFNGGTMNGNVSSGNLNNGYFIDFPGGNTATFQNNSATNNGGMGYRILGTPAAGGGNTGGGNTGGGNTGP